VIASDYIMISLTFPKMEYRYDVKDDEAAPKTHLQLIRLLKDYLNIKT